MKKSFWQKAHLTWTLSLLAVALATFTVRADENAVLVKYMAVPAGSLVTMDGTSTIHDWTVTSPIIGGYLEAPAGFPDSVAGQLDARVFIPVRTLKSYASHMDEVMQEHLKMTNYARIEYHLTALKTKAEGKLEFDATGELTVAGVTQTNTMPVTIEKLDGGKLKITGATALKMTDFKVEPPAPSILGMPLIKTGDDIKIKFEWVVAPKVN